MMPFFKKSSKNKFKISHETNSGSSFNSAEGASAYPPTTTMSSSTTTKQPKSILRSSKSSATAQETNNDHTKPQFHCQLAHGSATVSISGFNNIRDLYEKIATSFNIPPSSILFCTLNTARIEMDKLLGGQMGLNDLIFAHVKGQPKEVEIIKSEPTLGLTITDNGAGYAFIKSLRPGSIADRMKNLLKPGDHIEKINDRVVTGIRHFEVAKILKDFPIQSRIVLRLIEPTSFDFPLEAAKRGRGKSGAVTNGTKTLRFKANGQAVIEEVDDKMTKTVERINNLLETYMGINDSDLSRQIWDLAENKKNPSDFATAIDESELGAFNFTDEFIFDLWAAIGDIQAGRLASVAELPKESQFSERL